jgi:long-subunit acyl-CoA synthetase (AMP-forming)
LKSLSDWAKEHGTSKVHHQQQKKETQSLMFTVANTLVINRIKQALGLDKAKVFFFGAAPLK